MQYGITENPNGCFCANCNRPLSKDGIFWEKFCPECGAPLKSSSTKAYEAEIKKEQLRLIETIEEALPNNKIEKILADLKEEL